MWAAAVGFCGVCDYCTGKMKLKNTVPIKDILKESKDGNEIPAEERKEEATSTEKDA